LQGQQQSVITDIKQARAATDSTAAAQTFSFALLVPHTASAETQYL